MKLPVRILVLVMMIIALIGCSTRTPKIYTMPVNDLEMIRTNIKRIGVTVSSYKVKVEIDKPAEGVSGGIKRGVVTGAAIPVMVGLVSPVPGGTFIGALIAPVTAIAGGIYGATKGVPTDIIKEADTVIKQSLEQLREKKIRKSIVQTVVEYGNSYTDYSFVNLSDIGPTKSESIVRYDQLVQKDIDTVLELKIEKIGLKGYYSFNPPSFTFIELYARLIRRSDNQLLIEEKLYCTNVVPNTYQEWAANNGALFVKEFENCVPKIAQKVVDDLFLVYPAL